MLRLGAVLSIAACVVIAAFALFVTPAANAQITREEFEALKSEVGALKDGIKTQNELLKQFLERLGAARGDAPFKETSIGIDDDAVYG